VKKILSASLVALLFVFAGRPSFALDAVIDAANLVQSVLQYSHMGTDLAKQVAQVTNQQSQIQNQLRQLQNLANGNWPAYNNLLQKVIIDLQPLTGGTLDRIGYLGNIAAKWDYYFPDDLSNLTLDDYSAYLSSLDRLMRDVSQNAAVAQKSMARVAENTSRAQEILIQSEASEGEIGQMQALNQQIALTNASLNDLMTVAATQGRLLAADAARAATEREVTRAASADLVRNYTDRGNPAQIQYTKLP